MNFRIVIVICILIASVVSVAILLWIDDEHSILTEEFQAAKRKLRPRCSEQEFKEFMQFLKSYQGGYVRKKNGKIVSGEYLNKERAELKEIFLNQMIKNPNLTSEQKEEFRAFLRSIGVRGVEKRPSYETRDQQLRNNKKDENARKRKEVGNMGEQRVRTVLEPMSALQYAIINGPALRFDGETKEFDHIVIGKSGIFVIETKAYGMTDGKSGAAELIINSDDKWTLLKNNSKKDISSPTQQLMIEKDLLQNIISGPQKVHPILLLCNEEIVVQKNIKLPYAIVGINELVHYIYQYKDQDKDQISESEKLQMLQEIDRSRVN